MFLYARLIMDYLTSNIFYNGDEMKDSANQLPHELTELYVHDHHLVPYILITNSSSYRRILTRITNPLDERSLDRVRCLFGWIALAKRPLRKFELLSAVTFSSGDPEVARLMPQRLLDICGTFIEERGDLTLTFIHISVKE